MLHFNKELISKRIIVWSAFVQEMHEIRQYTNYLHKIYVYMLTYNMFGLITQNYAYSFSFSSWCNVPKSNSNFLQNETYFKLQFSPQVHIVTQLISD